MFNFSIQNVWLIYCLLVSKCQIEALVCIERSCIREKRLEYLSKCISFQHSDCFSYKIFGFVSRVEWTFQRLNIKVCVSFLNKKANIATIKLSQIVPSMIFIEKLKQSPIHRSIVIVFWLYVVTVSYSACIMLWYTIQSEVFAITTTYRRMTYILEKCTSGFVSRCFEI